jgi:glycosyltransferase involved in cell wall biosynthesis
MRVLFVCPNLAAGGVERAWSILLPGLRDRGYDARLIALDGGGPFAATLAARRVPFEILNMRRRTHVAPILRCAAVREFAPDVVVAQSVSGLCVGAAIARWRGARLIANEHSSGTLTPRREAMVRLLRPWIDVVAVVGSDQASTWLRRGCPAERIITVRNGVDMPTIAESRKCIRRELGIAEDATVAVLVASLRPGKRVSAFVKAVQEVRGVRPDLIGVVVGDGPERGAVVQAAGGDSGIRILGHRDDVPRVLKAADIFVLSSAYEAAPMAVLEAMAAGLPVIATDVGTVRSMVRDGETGLLVDRSKPQDLAAKLNLLMRQPMLRQAMGKAGLRRQREAWTAERMVDDYARVIRGQDTTAQERATAEMAA